MDQFHELNAFIAVVESGGFSAAARKTGESQSAVSKAVNALEKRLGVALLHRSTRKVTLTDQGQRYYERTKPLVDEIQAANSELASSTQDVSGLVRIAAPSTFGRLHVLPLIPELLSQHPGLRVDLVLSDAVRDMVEDRIDLAIRVSPMHDPDSVVRRVAGTSLVCAGSRRYFARRPIPKTPAELRDHNCLIYGDMTEWPFMGPRGRYRVRVQLDEIDRAGTRHHPRAGRTGFPEDHAANHVDPALRHDRRSGEHGGLRRFGTGLGNHGGCVTRRWRGIAFHRVKIPFAPGWPAESAGEAQECATKKAHRPAPQDGRRSQVRQICRRTFRIAPVYRQPRAFRRASIQPVSCLPAAIFAKVFSSAAFFALAAS
jgi:DNA-binding transcriptional LysR family regulator